MMRRNFWWIEVMVVCTWQNIYVHCQSSEQFEYSFCWLCVHFISFQQYTFAVWCSHMKFGSETKCTHTKDVLCKCSFFFYCFMICWNIFKCCPNDLGASFCVFVYVCAEGKWMGKRIENEKCVADCRWSDTVASLTTAMCWTFNILFLFWPEFHIFFSFHILCENGRKAKEQEK